MDRQGDDELIALLRLDFLILPECDGKRCSPANPVNSPSRGILPVLIQQLVC